MRWRTIVNHLVTDLPTLAKIAESPSHPGAKPKAPVYLPQQQRFVVTFRHRLTPG